MRNLVVLVLFAMLCVFIGCLGGSGGGGTGQGSTGSLVPSNAVISGKAYFPSSSLYGEIPILARDANGLTMGSTRTDAYGNFHFTELAPGIYNLFATTGETEVQFFTGVQVVPGAPVNIPDKGLVELKYATLDKITSTSARISFVSSTNCSSQVEYGTSVGNSSFVTVNSTFTEDHQVTIANLSPGARYGFTIRLQTQDGQQYSYPAMYTTTNNAVGPTNLAVNIENGDMTTRFTSARLHLEAENATEFRVGIRENLDDQPWEGISPFKDVTLPGGEGTKRVYVQFRDSFGNVSSVVNDSIQLQQTVSGYIGVWVNNGEALTNTNQVVLSLLFPGATQMQISDRADFFNSFWEIFSDSRRFAFSSEDGVKTIYVHFRGGNADSSKTFSASIVLDTTGPEVTMKINNGAIKTNSINVSLNFTPIQVPSQMQLEEDGVFDEKSTWVKFSNPYSYILSKGDGEKSVYARFKDELGNLYGPISAQIELDTTPPQNTSFLINNGDQTSDSLEIRLTISADEADQILISNNEDFVGAVAERYKTIKTWSLGGYGVQSIYMQFVDDASNTSSPLVQSIEVIGDPPASGGVLINQNDPTSEVATVSLYLFSDEAVKVRVSTHENFSSVPDVTYGANYSGGVMKIDNFALDPLAGEKKVYVRFENASGALSIGSDTISLVGPSSYSLATNDLQPLATYTVNLRPFAQKASQMLLTEDYQQLSNSLLWVPFSYSYNFAMTRANGKHTIYAKYRNIGGVETAIMSLDLTVSEVPSASPAIIINAGDPLTYRNNVQISVLTNTNYPIMRLSNDGNFFTAADQAAVDQPWFVSNLAGEKTVYARFLHKDTAEYFYASDTITAVGPSSYTISTNESMPLNKNWVDLNLLAVGASDMIVTEDAGIGSMTTGWIPYQNNLIFPLINKTGAHSVFAKYRNAATNWIETVAVRLDLTVNSVSPTGNLASIRNTAAPDSTVVAEAAVGSLPVYLHFTIVDPLTATISWKIASAGAPLPTAFNDLSAPAAPIPLSAGDFPGNGTFNIYYRFIDGVGNKSALQVLSVKILGPNIKISPAVLAPLKSGQTQQFSASLENAAGTVIWSISPALPASTFGSIDSAGLYTAPNPVSISTETVISAALFGDPSVNDSVNVKLQTQVEIYVVEKNHQISLNQAKNVSLIFRNSSLSGNALVGAGDGGTATISVGIPGTPPTDMLATLTFTAPGGIPVSNPSTVTVSSAEDPAKQVVFYFTINSGPWVSINPADSTARVRTGKVDFVATTSSSTAVLTWRLPFGGFFDVAKTQTTATTLAPHAVTVYTPDTFPALNPIKVVASFTEALIGYAATSSITLTSPVVVKVTPKEEVIDLANSTGINFQAETENAVTTQVTWQFKNTADSVWISADGPTNVSGSLRTVGNGATYLSPSTFPPTGSKSVNIRAISVDDPIAEDIATVTLIEPIEVVLHEGFNSAAPIVTTTTVTLEVGTRQFFAEIKNATAGTNLISKWYVEGVEAGNTTYGTVDNTGKYSAPDSAAQTQVTLRAVSSANAAKFADCRITLQDFWIPRSQNLTNVTNATDSIYCLIIDPRTPAGTDRILYCGTNGYGVYRATIPPSAGDYDWNTVNWTGVPGLSTNVVGMGASFTVNDLTMSVKPSADRVVAATNHGLFLITANGTAWQTIDVPFPRPANTFGAVTITDYSSDFTKVFSGVKIDPSDDKYLYAIGKDQGLLRFVWGGANYVYDGTIYDDNQLYSTVYFYDWPWSVNTGTVATPTIETGSLSRPAMSLQASGTMEFNCIEMNSQNPDLLYVGFTRYLQTRNPDVFREGYIKFSNIRTSEYLTIGQNSFVVTGNPPPGGSMSVPIVQDWTGGYPNSVGAPGGNNPETINDWRFIGGNGIINWDTGGIIHSIAVDPNTPTTIWLGKNDGIKRSTDDGGNFTALGTGYVNVRDVFIDPINTVNVYIGTEAGLYRTKNAGSSWKQIKTGLEGNTTLNALDLTPGGLGSRRIFLGTTNGAFMGRTTLDLE